MEAVMQQLSKKCVVGVVSGSDLPKIREQLSPGTEEDSKYTFLKLAVGRKCVIY